MSIKKPSFENLKDIYEDEHQQKLVTGLLSSQSYKIAEEDEMFLESYEARAIRLELDYLKAELALNSFGIKHTVVVFGSARIREEKVAKEILKSFKGKLKQNQNSEHLQQKVARAQKILEKSKYYDDAREFGKIVALEGKDLDNCPVVIATGGGPGIMEAANRGASDEGANSVGFNINLPKEQFPNPYITPELCFQFHYFAIRKLHFINRAKALVVYPGGFGTLDELFETMTLIQTKKTEKIPIVLISGDYWSRIINFDFLVEEGMISSEDIRMFKVVENAREAWEYIVKWYSR
ncbi:MAG: TIGR00730 family Rossman fold protein [Sulfurospirillum sp.]